MSKKKQVPMLVDLTLSSIGEFVTTETKHICMTSKTNLEYGHIKLHSMLEFMKYLFNSCIPRHLHDKMFVAVLTAIVNLVKETRGPYNGHFPLTTTESFLSEETVALPLTKVAVGPHLKTIKFSAWPSFIIYVLYDKLYDMVGLEVLELYFEPDYPITLHMKKMIASAVSTMPNLVCFILRYNCTDNIILALAKNCKKLQKLDVTKSKSVTRRSVGPLLSCKHLRHIKLHETSMTIAGYANLFLKHVKIEDIGKCKVFVDVLEHIYHKYICIHPLHIRRLELTIFYMQDYYRLIDMCPYIMSLGVCCNGRTVNLSILASFDDLKELKLEYCNFYTHGIETLLEIKGWEIISLHLEFVKEIDLNALILISQYCPDIRELVLCYESMEHAALLPRKLPVRPFQFLERIKCNSDCTNVHGEFLLSHCINIKSIQLIDSTRLGDATMRRILLQNPMSKLEVLEIDSCYLSMKSVQLLMQNCNNLRRLSDLKRWHGISRYELNIFRKDLKTTNTDLDIS